jgi:hypothetical protein
MISYNFFMAFVLKFIIYGTYTMGIIFWFCDLYMNLLMGLIDFACVPSSLCKIHFLDPRVNSNRHTLALQTILL